MVRAICVKNIFDWEYEMADNTQFVIIASGKNNQDWMDRHLKSVLVQNYKNYLYFYLNDNGTDDTINIYNKLVKKDDRFNIINNIDKEKTADFNTKIRLELFKNSNFSDEAVFVHLDGDDWFFSTDVLEYLNDVYKEEDVWLTYGNFIEYPSGLKSSIITEYSPTVVQNKLYRKDAWRASHLKTFKKKIAKNLEVSDFLAGDSLTFVGDQAIMFPMLEMANGKHKCLKKILYVYNRKNVNYDSNTEMAKKMVQQEMLLRAKPIRETII